MTAQGPGHVAVVGGGIAGLAAAWFLLGAGARVTLFESSDRLGGLGSTFEHEGHTLERFYHCMLPSDSHLLDLLAKLGLDTDTYWADTSFGYWSRGSLYGLNTARELLAFAPLTPLDRLRVGATGVWGSIRSAKGLDEISCEAWLTALSGRRAFEVFWRPMLEAKFGDRHADVPALWFWTRFNREKGAKRERKGYLHGGYQRITETLERSLRAGGALIRINSPVKRLSLGANLHPCIESAAHGIESFDRVVYTGPIATLPTIVDAGAIGRDSSALGAGIDMLGVINVVLLARRGFSPHYWVATVDPNVPFVGIVESTTLIERAEIGGAHLFYLTKYLHRSDPQFCADDEDIIGRYLGALYRIVPGLRAEDIIACHVFRSPFVEPIYTLGYERRKPPDALVPGRIYLATTAQVYPQVTSWNGSVGLASRVVDRLRADAGIGDAGFGNAADGQA